MPILENIKTTEAKVEEQKQHAIEEAKALIDNAKSDAEKEANKMISEAEAKAKQMAIENDALISKKRQEILEKCEQDNLHNQQIAEKNNSLVVDEIVRTVLEQ